MLHHVFLKFGPGVLHYGALGVTAAVTCTCIHRGLKVRELQTATGRSRPTLVFLLMGLASDVRVKHSVTPVLCAPAATGKHPVTSSDPHRTEGESPDILERSSHPVPLEVQLQQPALFEGQGAVGLVTLGSKCSTRA